MGLSHITIIASISLSGLLPSSCSKAPTAPQTAKAAKAPAPAGPTNVLSLGVIQLTNHCQTEIDLGNGETCTISPQVVDSRDLQLTLCFGATSATGKPTGLSVTCVMAQPNKPFAVTLNDRDLSFTPKVVE